MNSRPNPSFWECLQDHPPVYVRLLARKGSTGRGVYALTDEEIAIMAELTLTRVREINRMLNWDHVTVSEMTGFFKACGFDPTSAKCRKRLYNYIHECQSNQQKIPFLYLRVCPKFNQQLLPLINLLRSLTNLSTVFHPESSTAKTLSA